MWITPTISDFKRRFSGAEYEGITTAALADGQEGDAVVESVITDVVKLIRGKVAACRNNVLGAGNTIPDELLDAALSIVRWRVLTRLPNTGLADDPRELEYREALGLLDDVAACKFVIEQPETATEQVIASPVAEVIHSTCRQAIRERMNGL